MTKLNLLSNSYRRIGQTVLLVGLLFCLLPGTAMHTQTSQKPNIIFILVDDLRWDALSATGHPYVKTPNIDRIWHMGNHDQPKPGFDRWVSFRGQGRYIDVPLNMDGQAVDNKGYATDVLSDYTVEFIRRKHDKPFLAYLAHKAVHGPFDDPPGRETLYADLAVKRSPNAQDSLEGKPVLQRTTLLE